ncbi:MAG: glutamate--tRNA ligase family protein, partial [Pseudomonadales bacterium]
GAVYPGSCDGRYAEPPNAPYSTRLRVADTCRQWQDRVFGEVGFDMKQEVGDFIIKRKDGLDAYQLAVVVDDAWQQVNQIVRGADLLDSTPRQLELYHRLGFTPPSYLHHPVLTDTSGAKLSKQSHAAAIDTADIVANLRHLLTLLGQTIPNERQAPALLARAAKQWDISRIPQRHSIVVND